MNKKIFLVLLAFLIPLNAIAITADSMLDEGNLGNSGYSPETIRIIKIQHAKANGEIIDTKYKPEHQKVEAKLFHPTTWLKSIIQQGDPAEQADNFALPANESL